MKTMTKRAQRLSLSLRRRTYDAAIASESRSLDVSFRLLIFISCDLYFAALFAAPITRSAHLI